MRVKKHVPKPHKAPRTRSPNYPSLDLGTVASKLPGVFKAINRHPAGVETVTTALGYKHTSSSGLLALAAVRAYGVLEKVKGGAGSMVRLSALGLDIAVDYQSDSPEHANALKKAALMPPIHRDLWARYGNALPSDDEIRRVLVRELKFNDNAAGPLIAEYKATIAFAKLTADDKIAEDDGRSDDDESGEGQSVDAVVENPPQSVREKPQQFSVAPIGSTRKLPITLPSLQVAVLDVPFPMSEDDFKALSDSLAMFKNALTKKPD